VFDDAARRGIAIFKVAYEKVDHATVHALAFDALAPRAAQAFMSTQSRPQFVA
jgi:hypothetical protein